MAFPITEFKVGQRVFKPWTGQEELTVVRVGRCKIRVQNSKGEVESIFPDEVAGICLTEKSDWKQRFESSLRKLLQ